MAISRVVADHSAVMGRENMRVLFARRCAGEAAPSDFDTIDTTDRDAPRKTTSSWRRKPGLSDFDTTDR